MFISASFGCKEKFKEKKEPKRSKEKTRGNRNCKAELHTSKYWKIDCPFHYHSIFLTNENKHIIERLEENCFGYITNNSAVPCIYAAKELVCFYKRREDWKYIRENNEHIKLHNSKLRGKQGAWKLDNCVLSWDESQQKTWTSDMQESWTNGCLHLVLGSSNQLALRLERLACGVWKKCRESELVG